jgi:uncharacterized protein (TIGR02996 family)
MTESHFESILDQNPSDWDTRYQYADWLEEQGQQVRANGQRWQAVNKKRPLRFGLFNGRHADFDWIKDGKIPSEVFGHIPVFIWNELSDHINANPEDDFVKTYKSERDASIALAKALNKIKKMVEIQPTAVEVRQ